MRNELIHIRILFLRLGILLLLFTFCRILFYSFNAELFPAITFEQSVWIFLNGIRFDVSAIVYLNSIFILFHLIPNPWREKKFYQRLLKIIFYTVNLVALIFEASDFAYFKYSFKRITGDISFMEHDASTLMPAFLRDFWYLLLLLIAMLVFAEWLYGKTTRMIKLNDARRFNFASYIIVTVILFVAARGGVQSEPINPNTADAYLPSSLTPIAQNTSFTLLYSLRHDLLEEKKYFTDEDLPVHFQFIHPANPNKFPCVYNPNGKKDNVVIIIVESLSKEYVGSLNGKKEGYTPFLDSLIKQSLVFTNAYADGKKSIEGIPAVLSSVPGLINNPLINSSYQSEVSQSIASYLKQMGYHAFFFHGGSNGTMNFDKYISQTGFDEYFGKNEYPNKKDDDGVWGIFDEPYFQYFADKLNNFSQPFCSAIFSLTSHHPFALPAQYIGKFKKGQEPIMEVMQYTDMSLRKFFEVASQMSWYQNTLFVITADHCGPSSDPFYRNRVGMYQVPIIFFKPNSSLKGSNEKLVQQIDIMPSILDYLNYKGAYSSFGKSVFENEGYNYAVNFLGSTYQIIDDEYSLIFNGEKSIELYDYRKDFLLANNLVGQLPSPQKKMEQQLKAVIQSFNHAVIHNQLAAN